MSDERQKLNQKDEIETTEDVEAHRMNATSEPDTSDDEVEAHRLEATVDPDSDDDAVEAHKLV